MFHGVLPSMLYPIEFPDFDTVTLKGLQTEMNHMVRQSLGGFTSSRGRLLCACVGWPLVRHLRLLRSVLLMARLAHSPARTTRGVFFHGMAPRRPTTTYARWRRMLRELRGVAEGAEDLDVLRYRTIAVTAAAFPALRGRALLEQAMRLRLRLEAARPGVFDVHEEEWWPIHAALSRGDGDDHDGEDSDVGLIQNRDLDLDETDDDVLKAALAALEAAPECRRRPRRQAAARVHTAGRTVYDTARGARALAAGEELGPSPASSMDAEAAQALSQSTGTTSEMGGWVLAPAAADAGDGELTELQQLLLTMEQDMVPIAQLDPLNPRGAGMPEAQMLAVWKRRFLLPRLSEIIDRDFTRYRSAREECPMVHKVCEVQGVRRVGAVRMLQLGRAAKHLYPLFMDDAVPRKGAEEARPCGVCDAVDAAGEPLVHSTRHMYVECRGPRCTVRGETVYPLARLRERVMAEHGMTAEDLWRTGDTATAAGAEGPPPTTYRARAEALSELCRCAQQVRAVMRRGRGHGNGVLSTEAYERIFARVLEAPPPPPPAPPVLDGGGGGGDATAETAVAVALAALDEAEA